MEIMADLGVDDIPVVGVAKGPTATPGLERFFIPGKPPFMLEPKSPVLYYLQRLRDEAHRFAIGTHRVRRAIDMKKNPLDEIGGWGRGGSRRRWLHALRLGAGGEPELRGVDGPWRMVEGVVSEGLLSARRVWAYFRQGGEGARRRLGSSRTRRLGVLGALARPQRCRQACEASLTLPSRWQLSTFGGRPSFWSLCTVLPRLGQEYVCIRVSVRLRQGH
jgi:hypothetical protein